MPEEEEEEQEEHSTKKKKTATFTFSPSHGTLAPKQKVNVTVSCQAGDEPEIVRNAVRVQIHGSKPRFVRQRADVQQLRCSLDRTALKLGNSCVRGLLFAVLVLVIVPVLVIELCLLVVVVLLWASDSPPHTFPFVTVIGTWECQSRRPSCYATPRNSRRSLSGAC